MPHKILPAARERLIEIWEYTEKEWGDEQADVYITGLFDRLDKITQTPHLWKPVEHSDLRGVFFAKYEHHFVFFRKLSDTSLGVITILHESMNLPDRLDDDVTRNDER
ncbi:MAG: type II toxin-antitoxin system RelE/ParE family toxin [Verrucomicrobiales bacterium]|nr:type II toxin-antitoxin system RelE/ParE family toxin [Verrucomicrobiales bacterium]